MEQTPKELIEEIKKHFPTTFNTLKALPKHTMNMSSTEETNVSDKGKIESIRLVTKLLGCRVEFDHFIQDFKSGQQALFEGWEVCCKNSKYIFIQNQSDEILMFTKSLSGEIEFCSTIGLNGSSFVYIYNSLVKRVELKLKQND